MNAPPSVESPHEPPFRLLLVDAHDVSRRSSRALLDALPRLCVIGETGDTDEALQLAETLQPDVVLMSMRVRGSSGPEMTRQLCRRYPGLKVLFLTFFDSPEYVAAAMQAGASGYALKEAPADEFRVAVETVMRGERFMASGLSQPSSGMQMR